MGSLYDRYQLSNSTTIPQYQGSAGRESVQVGQYLQGLYDQNLAGAMNINSSADEVDTVLPQDKAAAEELRKTTQDQIHSISKSGDWENALPQVTQLGQNFANRYREIMAPQAAAQEYRTKTLTDKEKNLTPSQQTALMQMSVQQYPGLKKDARGRLIGQFNGIIPAKNIDVNEWIDKKLKDFATQKGGSEVYSGTDGDWLMKNGQKFERLSPGTIQSVLDAAMSNDQEFKGYMSQEGAIAGHNARDIDPTQLPDTMVGANGKQQPNYLKYGAFQLAKQYGIPVKEAYQKIIEEQTKDQIVKNARVYGETKYQKNDRFTTEDMTGNPFALKSYEKRINEVDPFGDLVTGQGIDLGQKYGNASGLADKIKTNSESLQSTENYLNGQKQRVAKAMGTTVDRIDDDRVKVWYAKNDPQELGKYQSSLQAIEGLKSSTLEANTVRDAAMDAAVKKATGNQYTFAQYRDKATADFKELVNNTKDGIGIGPIGNYERKQNKSLGQYEDKITKDNVKDYEVVGYKAGKAFDLSLNPEGIEIRNKNTGKTFIVPTGTNQSSHKELSSIAKPFKALDWKDSYAESVNGLRTNMVWMPLTNQGYNTDGSIKKSDYSMRAEGLMRAAAASSAIKIKDQNDVDLSSSDADAIKTAVSANKFNLLAIGTDPKSGERRASLSVEVDPSATDIAKKYKTVMVAADSNFWDRVSAATKNEAGRNMNSPEPSKRAAAIKTFQFANAMSSGSSYGQVAGALPGTSITVKDKNGTPIMRIMPNSTGDASNARVHQIYKLGPDGKPTGEAQTMNDDLHLSTYLDMLRQDGNVITQNE